MRLFRVRIGYDALVVAETAAAAKELGRARELDIIYEAAPLRVSAWRIDQFKGLVLPKTSLAAKPITANPLETKTVAEWLRAFAEEAAANDRQLELPAVTIK